VWVGGGGGVVRLLGLWLLVLGLVLLLLRLLHGLRVVGGLRGRAVLLLRSGLLVALLVLPEGGVVVAGIVGPVVSVVVAAEGGLGLGSGSLVLLRLVLLLWLIARRGHGLWGSRWCLGQMISRGLETKGR